MTKPILQFSVSFLLIVKIQFLCIHDITLHYRPIVHGSFLIFHDTELDKITRIRYNCLLHAVMFDFFYFF